MIAHLVYFALVGEDTRAQEEREQQFVLLEQTTTHVTVQTEREVPVDAVTALHDVLCVGVSVCQCVCVCMLMAI